ncbi:MAG: archease [Candidatus Aminicenantes bacterium]|nr:archease [Candidatus Aminicenantes bacterium]
MQKFLFLEHTGDAKFRAYGATLEEAFANAALALVSLMWDASKVADKKAYSVRIEGRDMEQLLSGFLEEILYLLDTKDFLLACVEKVRITRGRKSCFLKAVFRGDEISSAYEIFGEVKAVTYNEMEIQENNGAEVQVVVDL